MLVLIDDLKKVELNYDFMKWLVVIEELKFFLFGVVWDEFCLKNNILVGIDWFDEIYNYE